jgi:predicted enzyme related to lactoylglutathione lyase
MSRSSVWSCHQDDRPEVADVTSEEDAMSSGVSTVIYPVKDLAQAKAVYGRLWGAEPTMDEPYYVGYRVGDLDLGLDPNGHAKGMTGPVTYFEVDDIAERLRQLQEAGATTRQGVTDVGGGKLVATVTDADGNVVGLTQSP